METYVKISSAGIDSRTVKVTTPAGEQINGIVSIKIQELLPNNVIMAEITLLAALGEITALPVFHRRALEQMANNIGMTLTPILKE